MCTYAFNLHPPTPSTSIQIFFKDDKQIYFVNYYRSKNYKHRYKIKRLLYKAIRKCLIKTARRALESSLCFDCAGETRLDKFDCLNRSLPLFYFYFVTNLRRKKFLAYLRLQLNLATFPALASSTLLAGPLPPSSPPSRAYVLWMTPCWIRN